MKKIYTSNYARNSSNPNAVAISGAIPEWYEGDWMKILAPKKDMVGRLKNNSPNYSQRKYTRDYLELLKSRNLTPEKVIKMIPANAILLCYESPGDFCHRRLLADWLTRHTGIEIPEWQNEKEENESDRNKVVDSILDF